MCAFACGGALIFAALVGVCAFACGGALIFAALVGVCAFACGGALICAALVGVCAFACGGALIFAALVGSHAIATTGCSSRALAIAAFSRGTPSNDSVNRYIRRLGRRSHETQVRQLLASGVPVNRYIRRLGRRSHETQVHQLLASGVPVDERHPKTQRTALMLACEYGHLNIVSMLLEARADPTKSNTDYGTNALQIAITHLGCPRFSLWRSTGPKTHQICPCVSPQAVFASGRTSLNGGYPCAEQRVDGIGY